METTKIEAIPVGASRTLIVFMLNDYIRDKEQADAINRALDTIRGQLNAWWKTDEHFGTVLLEKGITLHLERVE